MSPTPALPAAEALPSGWAPLSTFSLWRFRGPDARRLLNGLITANVRDLPVGGVAATAWCDTKGRVAGLADVWSLADDEIWMLVEGVDPDAFEARFARYIVFDDAELDRVDAPGELITLQAPLAPERLAALGWSGSGVARWRGGVAASRPRGPGWGLDVWDPTGEVRAAVAGLETLGEAELDLLRVVAGQPAWPDDIGDKELPHHAGLRERCLHFEKGCYIGQEVVHRMEAMGRPRKGLFRVWLAASAAVGATLYAGEVSMGRLGRAAPLPTGGLLALAVLRLEAGEPGAELRAGEAGPRVVVLGGPVA